MQSFSQSVSDFNFLLAFKLDIDYLPVRLFFDTYSVTADLATQGLEKLKKEVNCIAFAVILSTIFEEVL